MKLLILDRQVGMTLPLAKLGVLVIKQLAKPCANVVKRTVKKSELLGKVIAFPAQVYHRTEQTVRMRILGWDKEVTIKPLSQKAATDLGAELLGEFFVLGVAISTLYFEVKRSSSKEQKKEELQNDKLRSLQEQINSLHEDFEKQVDVNLKLTLVVDELVNKLGEFNDNKKS